MAFTRLGPLDELWSGEPAGRTVDGRRVLLLRRGDEVVAYEDRCAHLGLPLSGGRLEGDVLTCPAHHWSYDIRGGRGINPSSACLKPFRVKVEDGEVWVDVSDA